MRRILILCAGVAALLLSGLPGEAVAKGTRDARVGSVTNLPIPRYVSLRASRINVRRGPGLSYRKDWVFQRAGLPVRVVEEYGDWRRIVDKDEAGGWVYHAMLTGRRTVLITAESVFLRKTPADTAKAVAEAEGGVVARLGTCNPQWCSVQADGHQRRS